MKTSNTLLTTLAIAGALFCGTASAQGAFADVTTPGAAYATVSNAPVAATLSRDEVLAGIAALRNNPISADGQLRFVGGEGGWERIQTSSTSVEGRLARPVVNAEDFNQQYRMFNPSLGS